MNKKLVVPIAFCLLGIAILSNRFFLLQQVRFALKQNPSFHLPVNNPEHSQERRRMRLIALPSEGFSDMQETARDFAEIKMDLGNTLQQSRLVLEIQTPPSLTPPPAYIFQSALNL